MKSYYIAKYLGQQNKHAFKALLQTRQALFTATLSTYWALTHYTDVFPSHCSRPAVTWEETEPRQWDPSLPKRVYSSLSLLLQARALSSVLVGTSWFIYSSSKSEESFSFSISAITLLTSSDSESEYSPSEHFKQHFATIAMLYQQQTFETFYTQRKYHISNLLGF